MSACCEFKHPLGAWLGGRAAGLQLVSVRRGEPCAVCKMADLQAQRAAETEQLRRSLPPPPPQPQPLATTSSFSVDRESDAGAVTSAPLTQQPPPLPLNQDLGVDAAADRLEEGYQDDFDNDDDDDVTQAEPVMRAGQDVDADLASPSDSELDDTDATTNDDDNDRGTAVKGKSRDAPPSARAASAVTNMHDAALGATLLSSLSTADANGDRGVSPPLTGYVHTHGLKPQPPAGPAASHARSNIMSRLVVR
jgi:hypothetical protein